MIESGTYSQSPVSSTYTVSHWNEKVQSLYYSVQNTKVEFKMKAKHHGIYSVWLWEVFELLQKIA